MRCSLLCPWHGTDCPSCIPNYGSGWIHAGIRYAPALRPASPSSRCSLLLKASNKYPQSTLTATGDNCICFTDELENVEQWDLPREPGPVARARAACQVPGPARGEERTRGRAGALAGHCCPRPRRHSREQPPGCSESHLGHVTLGPPCWHGGTAGGTATPRSLHPSPVAPKARAGSDLAAWHGSSGSTGAPWQRGTKRKPRVASRLPPPRVTSAAQRTGCAAVSGRLQD